MKVAKMQHHQQPSKTKITALLLGFMLIANVTAWAEAPEENTATSSQENATSPAGAESVITQEEASPTADKAAIPPLIQENTVSSTESSEQQEKQEAPLDENTSTPPFHVQEEQLQLQDNSATSHSRKEEDSTHYRDEAILQGLNKITARTSELKVKLGDFIRFGNLKIILHACWKSPPEEEPENKALLEVWEEIPGEQRIKIFSGWMFSSSPLISAPQHPVYDVTLVKCTGNVPKPDDSAKAE